MFGYIYLTTNTVNGKKYIGKKQSDHFIPEYHGSGRYLVNAIKKFGSDKFSTVLLEECDSLESLNAAEQRHIAANNAVESEDFYNISGGGDGGNVTVGWTEEQFDSFRKKMSDVSKGRVRIHKGGKEKYIPAQDISKYLEAGWAQGGLPQSREQRLKRSKSMSGKKFMTDGVNNIRVNIDDSECIERFMSAGFVFGTSKTPKQIAAQQRREEAAKRRKQQKEEEIKKYLASSPRCETCGKVITEFIGSGRFCSKSCASTHPHSEETKKKLKDMNLSGVCGRRGIPMSEEEKNKHKKALKNYYETNHFVWMTDGTNAVRVRAEEQQIYIDQGFKRGMKCSTIKRVPWNKGLTMNDERVKKNIDARNATMVARYGTLNVAEVSKLKEESNFEKKSK